MAKMRILTAALLTETNSFSPFATGLSAFEEQGIRYRGDPLQPTGVAAAQYHLAGLAEADGHETVASLSAFAQPAGPTLAATYATLRDAILRDARECGPFDAALLMLHGAMIAQDCDDCEGDLLERLRGELGPDAFIGAVLDPHCHLTDRMTQAADAIILMREYPHIDGQARMDDLYRLCLDTKAGRVRPVSAVRDCRMVGTWPTTDQPMRAFVDQLAARVGSDGICAINIVHGFPWGDTADSGAKVHVIVDGDPDRAGRLADEVAEQFWALRHDTRMHVHGIDEGLDQIGTVAGLTVLADMADNAGGGAPSDSCFVLDHVLRRGLRDIALGLYWDPGAVHMCAQAGIGTTLPLRVGGKTGPASGQPVDLLATVRGYREDHRQRGYDGVERSLGPSVWISASGIDLVLTSHRSQTFGPDAFTGLGIDLSTRKAVVVKSTQHFQYGFAAIAGQIIRLSGPGALTTDFGAIPYRHRPLDYWPRVERSML